MNDIIGDVVGLTVGLVVADAIIKGVQHKNKKRKKIKAYLT